MSAAGLARRGHAGARIVHVDWGSSNWRSREPRGGCGSGLRRGRLAVPRLASYRPSVVVLATSPLASPLASIARARASGAAGRDSRPDSRSGRLRAEIVSARRRLTDWTKTRDRDLKTKTVIGPAMRCMHRACRGAPTPGPRAREYHDCVTTAIGRTCRTSHSPHTCHVPRGLAVLQLRRLAPRPGRRGASALPYKV